MRPFEHMHQIDVGGQVPERSPLSIALCDGHSDRAFESVGLLLKCDGLGVDVDGEVHIAICRATRPFQPD